MVLDPQVVAFTCYFWPEILHLFLAVAAVRVLVSTTGGWRWAAVLGALVGAALPTKNVLGPVDACRGPGGSGRLGAASRSDGRRRHSGSRRCRAADDRRPTVDGRAHT
jgi:hypothetical protein